MGVLHSSRDAYVFAGAVHLCAICIVAFAITDICLNRYQLNNVYSWCTHYPFTWWRSQCSAAAQTCWFSPEPFTSMTACSYLYTVGAVALFWQTVILITSCMSQNAAYGCTAVFALCNFGWWFCAGIYYSLQIRVINDTSYSYQGQSVSLPAGNYRNAVQGVTWAAFAVSLVQLAATLASIRVLVRTQDHQGDSQYSEHEEYLDPASQQLQQQKQQDSEMMPPPLPPQPQQTYEYDTSRYTLPSDYQPPPARNRYPTYPNSEAGPNNSYPARPW